MARGYHAATISVMVCAACSGAWAGDAPRSAMRVVSLSPVASEIVLALGHGGRLVAVDAESARLPGLGGLPVVDEASLVVLSPDLLLASPARAGAARRAVPDVAVVEVAPHDFDEAWDLYRSIGAALGHAQEASRYVREASRPLAEIGAASFGKRRPRAVVVLALEPLEIAGGHSFFTDVIEMAGGESVSHGTEAPRLAWSVEEVAAAAPELALLVTTHEATPEALALARTWLGPDVRVEPLVLDPERFWIDEPVAVVERVRGWLDALRAP